MAIFDEKVSEYKKPLIKPHQETTFSISKFVEEKLGKVSPAEKKSIYDLIEKKLKNKISPKNKILLFHYSINNQEKQSLPDNFAQAFYMIKHDKLNSPLYSLYF